MTPLRPRLQRTIRPRVAAAEPARLRSRTQSSPSLPAWFAWKSVSPGLTTASRPNAASWARQLLRGVRLGRDTPRTSCASRSRLQRTIRPHVAAAEPARLRSRTQSSPSLLAWFAWKNVSPGLTTASRPNAASWARQLLRGVRLGRDASRTSCASRPRLQRTIRPHVAAAEPARLRSRTQSSPSLAAWFAWESVSPGLTTASRPNAASWARQLLRGVRLARDVPRTSCASLSRLQRTIRPHVAAAEPARLRSRTQSSPSLLAWFAWESVSPGFTTASRPNAASRARQLLRELRLGRDTPRTSCASRPRLQRTIRPHVAAAEPARLRSRTQSSPTLPARFARKNVLPGFTTASRPNAASRARQLLRG